MKRERETEREEGVDCKEKEKAVTRLLRKAAVLEKDLQLKDTARLRICMLILSRVEVK